MGDGDEERYTSGGDPNGAVLNAAMDDMRPDFAKHDSNDNSDSDDSRDALRSSEESASRATGGASGDSQDDMNQAESNIESDYANNVSGEQEQSAGDKVKSAISQGKKAKRAAPLIGLLTSLLGGGMGFAGVQHILPYSLVNIFKANFSEIDTINNIRGDSSMRRLIKGVAKYHTDGLNDAQHEATMAFDFSPRQIERFERSKIKIDKSSESMIFRDKIKVVVDKEKADPGNQVYFFDDYYADNIDFHVAYNSATATWRKSTSQYLSESMDNYYNFRGIAKKIVNGGTTAIKGLIKTAKSAGAMFQNISAETDNNDGKTLVGSDSDNEIGKLDLDNEDIQWDLFQPEGSTKQNSVAAVADKAKSVAGKLAKAGEIANIVCSVFTIITAFFQLVFQDSAFRMLTVAQQFFGAIQKTQAGDARELGSIMQSLSKDAKQFYASKVDGHPQVKYTGTDENDPDNEHESHIQDVDYEWGDSVEKTGNALTSEGIQGLYSGNIANTYSDESASQFNLFSALEGASKHVDLAVSNFRKCAFTRLATDMAAFVGDLAMVAGCLATLGMGCLLEVLEKATIAIGKGAIKLAITYIVSNLLAYLIPQLIAVYVPDVLNNLLGEDLGNMLTSAGNTLIGGAGQFAGGSFAGMKSFASYEMARLEVVADNARYEREVYSPFDLRSSNTFFGSIANQLVPVTAYVGVSISGGVKSFGTLLSNSVNKLLPTANALNSTVNAANAVTSTKNHCPMLDSVGAVGDPFCNPYIVSDLSTADSSPAEVIMSEAVKDSLNEDPASNGLTGTYTIKDDSGLAKWIKYCSRRSSPLGIPDQNIASDLGVKIGATASTVAQGVPIVGSAINLLNDARALAYAGYITGEACVTNNSSGTYNNASGIDIQALLEYQDNKQQKEENDKKIVAFYNWLMGTSYSADYAQNAYNDFYNKWNSKDGKRDIYCHYYYCYNGQLVRYEPNDDNKADEWGEDLPWAWDTDVLNEIENDTANFTVTHKSDGTIEISPHHGAAKGWNNGQDLMLAHDMAGTPLDEFIRDEDNDGYDNYELWMIIDNLYDDIYKHTYEGSDSLVAKIAEYEAKRASEKYKFEAVVSGSPTWEEARAYQRFAQDQASLQDMGIIDKSAVATYHEKLNKDLDNSYLGIMARYTGMTKDYIVAVIDGMEVLDWIAQYDPTDFSPTPAEHVEEPDHQFEEDEYNSSTYIAYYTQTFFEDRRQRNFAA